MLEKIINLITLENYTRLIRGLLPNTMAVGMFDRDGELIWTDDQSQDSIITATFSASQHSTKPAIGIQQKELESGDKLFTIYLTNTKDYTMGHLVILVKKDNSPESDQATTIINDVLNAVRDIIQNEFLLTSELESMAEELAVRYEELNLIFGREDSEKEMTSLHHLVKNCTGFLDVGLSALILPDKNIAIYDFNQSNPIPHPHNVQPDLTTKMYQWVKQNEQSLIINDTLDSNRLETYPKIPHKILACPVVIGNSNIIGIIAIFNQHSKYDFTNSDRNLLDVICKKASKIIYACYDPLTGLENANSFEWKIKEALTQSRLKGQKHVVLNLDMNQTKVINDISGRKAGDALIRLTGEVIKGAVRNKDSVARLMGDKFGVLLENCSLEVATKLAQKIRQEINDISFEWNDETYDVSTSIGVATISAESESVAAIISSVEVARDTAKEHGRNQLQIFKRDDADLLRRRDRMHWVGRIQNALRKNRFQLYSQLVQPLQPGNTTTHYEILIRMLGEDGEVVLPGAFLPAAEHFHMMSLIDRWVVERSLDMLGDKKCHISINLSGQSLCEEGFQQLVLDLIDDSAVSPDLICFEITESAAIANMKEAMNFIDALKIKGCSFSLDDFGTGLSSFSYLKNLDVDYLKIDGSFVREIIDDPIADTMVLAIHQIGNSMGLKTIAEFVENDTIQERLIEMGIDYGQGYELGKPQPFQDQLLDTAV